MKFRTEMRETAGFYVPATGYDAIRSLQHDSAAAHALMLAIDEIGTRGIQDADEITNRADEIMRGWGFDDGEVE